MVTVDSPHNAKLYLFWPFSPKETSTKLTEIEPESPIWKRKQPPQMTEQPTSKLTSVGPTSAVKLKVEAGPALVGVYLNVKEWVCVTKLHVWAEVLCSIQVCFTDHFLVAQSVCAAVLYVDNLLGLVWPTFMKKHKPGEFVGNLPKLWEQRRLVPLWLLGVYVCVRAGALPQYFQYGCIFF